MKIETLTKDKFTKWGNFISADETEGRAECHGFNYVGNVAVFEMSGTTSASILEPTMKDLVLTHMERHDKTVEMCVALYKDCVFAVAENKDGEPDVSTMEAFYLKQGDTVVYKAGTWHWVPFAVEGDYCRQLIVYKDQTGANDFYMVELPEIIKLNFERDII